MQADSREGMQRAPQILAGEDESPRSNDQTQLYPAHFRYKMDPENKRTLKLWAIEKSFAQEIGSEPATIWPNNKSKLIIEMFQL